jgi:hypothetical protein
VPGLSLTNVYVTLNPGLYTFTGGVRLHSVNLSGNGVTFFFTKVAGTTNFGTVLMDGNTNNYIYAPTGGVLGSPVGGSHAALNGILFFMDRNWVNSAAEDVRMGGETTFGGILYMPSTGLHLQDGASICTSYCGVVADHLYMANDAFYIFGSDYTRHPGTNPLRSTSVLVQ